MQLHSFDVRYQSRLFIFIMFGLFRVFFFTLSLFSTLLAGIFCENQWISNFELWANANFRNEILKKKMLTKRAFGNWSNFVRDDFDKRIIVKPANHEVVKKVQCKRQNIFVHVCNKRLYFLMKTGSYFKRVIKVKSVTCIVHDEMQKSVAHFYQPSNFLLNFSINGIESFFRSFKVIALNFSMKWKKEIAISFSTQSPDPDPHQVPTEITIRNTKWIR